MEERKHIIGALGDNFVVIPWTTFEKDGLHQGIEDRNVLVQFDETMDVDEVISNITGTMRKVHRLRPGQPNDFDVVASETFGELIDKVTGGVALVLVVLSSVGLLVGGIGVMNIMLISVTERTREIGVRMALGARRQDVLFQVLVEAGVLTGIGGLIGIGLGYLASWGMTHLLRFPFEISPWVTIGAAAFSVAIGVFFRTVSGQQGRAPGSGDGAGARIVVDPWLVARRPPPSGGGLSYAGSRTAGVSSPATPARVPACTAHRPPSASSPPRPDRSRSACAAPSSPARTGVRPGPGCRAASSSDPK